MLIVVTTIYNIFKTSKSYEGAEEIIAVTLKKLLVIPRLVYNFRNNMNITKMLAGDRLTGWSITLLNNLFYSCSNSVYPFKG